MKLCAISGMKHIYSSKSADKAIETAKTRGLKLYKYLCSEWKTSHYHLSKRKNA